MEGMEAAARNSEVSSIEVREMCAPERAGSLMSWPCEVRTGFKMLEMLAPKQVMYIAPRKAQSVLRAPRLM